MCTKRINKKIDQTTAELFQVGKVEINNKLKKQYLVTFCDDRFGLPL